MSRNDIPTEEEISKVETYYMIHQGHTSAPKHASVKVYKEEEFDKMKEDLMVLALKHPNKRFYWLKTQGSFVGKAKDVVLEATEDKKK